MPSVADSRHAKDCTLLRRVLTSLLSHTLAAFLLLAVR
jgi:hypothetical protein